jgi:PleD family two-component response regulator
MKEKKNIDRFLIDILYNMNELINYNEEIGMPANNLKGKTILIVAEPGQMIDGICSRLRTQGVAIEFISSGFQAVALIEKAVLRNSLVFNLVILFENCHDMPQREILNLVRLSSPINKLPILCMSKETDVADIKIILKEGSNDFLIDYDNFNKVLDKVTSTIK